MVRTRWAWAIAWVVCAARRCVLRAVAGELGDAVLQGLGELADSAVGQLGCAVDARSVLGVDALDDEGVGDGGVEVGQRDAQAHASDAALHEGEVADEPVNLLTDDALHLEPQPQQLSEPADLWPFVGEQGHRLVGEPGGGQGVGETVAGRPQAPGQIGQLVLPLGPGPEVLVEVGDRAQHGS